MPAGGGRRSLISESSGDYRVGERGQQVARRAGVRRLVLVHYRPAPHKYDRWIEEAVSTFGGPVELGQDLKTYEF